MGGNAFGRRPASGRRSCARAGAAVRPARHTPPRRPKEPSHARRAHRRPQPQSPPRLHDRRDVRGRPRADRHRDQVDPRGQGPAVRRVRARRARRGLAHRRAHRALRAGQPLQPRAQARAQAPAPSLRDRRAARARRRPRARPSSRCGSTSTARAGPRSSWGSPAASSSTTAAGTSPTATPDATSPASSRTPSAGAEDQVRRRTSPSGWPSAPSSRRSTPTRPASPAGSSSAGSTDVPGATMFDKMTWLQANRDDLRLRMLREPRGYPAANCNLILPSSHPEADAGYVIMEQVEYPGMSGTNTMCVVTVLLETGHAADDRADHRAHPRGAGRPHPGDGRVPRRQGPRRDVPERAGVRDPHRRGGRGARISAR